MPSPLLRWLAAGVILALVMWARPRPEIPLAYAHAQPFMFAMPEGKALLLDAGHDAQAGEGSAQVVDPPRRRTRAMSRFSLPRAHFTATALSDGRILIAGGNSVTVRRSGKDSYSLGFGGVPAEALLFDSESGELSPAGRMLAARWEHAAALLPDGRVLVAGGRDEKRGLDQVEISIPGLDSGRQRAGCSLRAGGTRRSRCRMDGC